MDLTKEEFAAQFDRLSTGELLRRYESGGMIPLAREAARNELLARGVDLGEAEKEERRKSAESQSSTSAVDDIANEFVTIARIVNPLRANLLKVHLESEGIVSMCSADILGW